MESIGPEGRCFENETIVGFSYGTGQWTWSKKYVVISNCLRINKIKFKRKYEEEQFKWQETAPVLTSDIGDKTVLFVAHSF